MVTTSILLSFLFFSGVLADCSKSALHVFAPEKMTALSGSCLQIPCCFKMRSDHKFNRQRQCFGVWIKSDPRFAENPDNVIFNSSKASNTYPMRIIGNLRDRNCTTLFSSLLTTFTGEYYFRIENKPFLATAACEKLTIDVQDSPPSPRIEISNVELKEKESVTITCYASTPCPHFPPQLTLNLQQDSDNKVEKNKDGSFTTKIEETITLSDQHDGYNINCSARYPVNEGKDSKTATARMTLRVSYAPKDTSVSTSLSGPVSAGTWVNLTCSSRANPPISRFTWFKRGKDGPMNVSEGHFYSFDATDGGVYYCVATNVLGENKSQEIDLNTKGAEPLSSSRWGAAVGGIIGIVVLICVVVAVWWFKSKHPTSQQTQSLKAEEPVGQEPAKASEKEDIHYGEISFSKRKPEASSASAQDSGQPQDVLYAQVNMSRTANSLTKTAESPDSIYAQVKKK